MLLQRQFNNRVALSSCNRLEYLGFNKSIRVTFSSAVTRPTLKRIVDGGGFDEYLTGNRRPGHELKRLIIKLEGLPEKTAEVIEATKYYLDNFHSGSIELPITEAGALESLAGEPINELFATLLDCGILRLRGGRSQGASATPEVRCGHAKSLQPFEYRGAGHPDADATSR